MQDQILQVDENMLETKLDRLVSRKVEELLNAMLDAEADEITGAARYERTGERRAYRAGHYERDLTVKAGTVTLKVPKLKGALFESAVIDRYRRREQSVEEALIDMYLAGVSTRQVDDISRLLWGERHALPDPLRQAQEGVRADRRMAQQAVGAFVPVPVRGRRAATGARGAGRSENVSVLVAIGVDDTGHREVVGVAEGMKEDGASWEQFVRSPDRTRSQGRAARGGRPVRRAGGHGELDAAGREIPAVHGPLHAQRALQGQPQTRGMGGRRAQGRVRHGIPRRRVEEGGGCGRADGIPRIEGRRILPQGGHRRVDHLPARRLPRRAPSADPHEQHDRTIEPGDPPPHPRRRPASRMAGARSCSSAPGSATSPPTNGARAATWTLSRLDGIMQSTD